MLFNELFQAIAPSFDHSYNPKQYKLSLYFPSQFKMKSNVGRGGVRFCEKFNYYLHKIKNMNKKM